MKKNTPETETNEEKTNKQARCFFWDFYYALLNIFVTAGRDTSRALLFWMWQKAPIFFCSFFCISHRQEFLNWMFFHLQLLLFPLIFCWQEVMFPLTLVHNKQEKKIPYFVMTWIFMIIIGYFSLLKYIKKTKQKIMSFLLIVKKTERKIIASPNVVNENKKRTSFSHTLLIPRKFGQNMFKILRPSPKVWQKFVNFF